MRTIALDGDRLAIAFEFSPAVLAGLRAVDGRKVYDGPRQRWLVPVDGLDLGTLAEFAQRFAFDVRPEAQTILGAVTPSPIRPPAPRSDRHVEIADGAVRVTFPYDEDIVSRCAVLGGSFNRARRQWSLPLTVETASALLAPEWEAFTGRDAVSQELQRLDAVRQCAIAESQAASGDLAFPWLPSTLVPMPFQVAGVAAIRRRKCALLADQPGLGKTIQALLLAGLENLRGTVCVVPTVVGINWTREARTWLPRNWTIAIVDGPRMPSNWRTVDLLIVPTSRIAQAMQATIVRVPVAGKVKPKKVMQFGAGGIQTRAWRCVVFDEAHQFKNREADRTKCALELAKLPEYVLPMTGTAIQNRPNELVTLLTMTRVIDQFGGAFKFMIRYCDGKRGQFGWDFKGASNLAELNTRLRETVMIRRLKSEVLADLPEKFTPRRVTLDIDNRRDYERAEDDFTEWLRANGTGQLSSAQKAIALVKIGALRQLVGRGKLAGAVEWIRDLVDTGEPVVVFARHIEVQRGLIAAFPGCAKVTGDMTSVQRQAQVDRFQRDHEADIIISSLAAGGVGWTGTRAAHVVTVELDWTPGGHEQGEDRVHRIGQTRAVTPWYLVADSTIDDKLWALLGDKENVTARTLDGVDGAGFAVVGRQEGAFDAILRDLANREM